MSKHQQRICDRKTTNVSGPPATTNTFDKKQKQKAVRRKLRIPTAEMPGKAR